MGKDTLLIDTIKNGDLNTAIKLLNKNRKTKLIGSGKKLNINYQDENGMSSLHQATVTGNYEIVKLLIENGAKVDLKDNKGYRSLHYASLNGKTDIVNLLIRCNSNCNEPSFNGDTPLHLASQNGHSEIVYQLIHYGADPTLTNTRYLNALDLACEFGRTKIVEILLKSSYCSKLIKNISKDLIDPLNSTTCLHLASKNAYTDIIRLLLCYGIDVNRYTHQGTALHEACRYGRYQSAKVLLESGIDINHVDYNEQLASDVIIKQKVGNDIKRLIKEFSECVYAVSIEPYLDNHAGSLNFEKNEYITVLERNPSGHWRGFVLLKDYTTRFGYFPSAYVKLIDRTATRSINRQQQIQQAHQQQLQLHQQAQQHQHQQQQQPQHTQVQLPNHVVSACATAAINALNAGKITRFSSALSTINNGTTVLLDKQATLDEITCDISPVGSIDSSSKISLISNNADSGVGTTSHKSLSICTTSSPPSSCSTRNNTIDRNSTSIIYDTTMKNSLLLQSFTNQKTSSPLIQTTHFDDSSTDIYGTATATISNSPSTTISASSSSFMNEDIISVTDLLRTGMTDSEIMYKWLSEINLQMYYQNFVNTGYDLLTVMKMTPSDLCAIGISDPMHRKLLMKQMKRLNIKDLDETLNRLLKKTTTIKSLLELIHLEQYLPSILEQDYKTLNDLLLINCEDLEEIGIKKLGHQKKFMIIIKRMQSVIENNGHKEPSTQVDNLYATIRNQHTQSHQKPSLFKTPFSIFSQQNEQQHQQQQHQIQQHLQPNMIQMSNNAKSLENLATMNHNNNNNKNCINQLQQQQQQHQQNQKQQQQQQLQNKPIPPQRIDSISKYSQECLLKSFSCTKSPLNNKQITKATTNQSTTNGISYATLPRKRIQNINNQLQQTPIASTTTTIINSKCTIEQTVSPEALLNKSNNNEYEYEQITSANTSSSTSSSTNNSHNDYMSNSNNYLPFANENVGTIKLKSIENQQQQHQQSPKQQQIIDQLHNRHQPHLPISSSIFVNQEKLIKLGHQITAANKNNNNINNNVNNTNNNNNNNNNDNVLNDIDFMLSDLNKQLDAMLEYEKNSFKS